MRDVPIADEEHCEAEKNNNMTNIDTFLRFLEGPVEGQSKRIFPSKS